LTAFEQRHSEALLFAHQCIAPSANHCKRQRTSRFSHFLTNERQEVYVKSTISTNPTSQASPTRMSKKKIARRRTDRKKRVADIEALLKEEFELDVVR
jgi:hypothetical protein